MAIPPEHAKALREGLPIADPRLRPPKPPPRASEGLLTLQQVSAVLHVHRSTLWRWRKGISKPRAVRLRVVDVLASVRSGLA